MKKIRVPVGRPDQRLDAKSLWHLPNVLDDPEERAIARELFIQCHPTGSRRVGDVTELLGALHPHERKTLLGAIRRKLGLRPSCPRHMAKRLVRVAAVCGMRLPAPRRDDRGSAARLRQAVALLGARRPGRPGGHAAVASGVRLAPSGVFVEYNASLTGLVPRVMEFSCEE